MKDWFHIHHNTWTMLFVIGIIVLVSWLGEIANKKRDKQWKE